MISALVDLVSALGDQVLLQLTTLHERASGNREVQQLALALVPCLHRLRREHQGQRIEDVFTRFGAIAPLAEDAGTAGIETTIHPSSLCS